jgi:hypothetical protein
MDIRLGLHHTAQGVWYGRQAKWRGGYREDLVGGKAQGGAMNHCEERESGFPRHVRHCHEKNLKSLLSGEGGGWCFIVAWCVVEVDQLVSHEWRRQRVGRRESARLGEGE